MNPNPHAPAHPSADPQPATDRLADVLFVMWGFPEPTQTFIHRELIEMVRQGHSVHILAARPTGWTPDDPTLAELVRNTIWLPSPARWPVAGAWWAVRHPLRFARVLLQLLSAPHRDAFRRARAGALVLAAAAVADRVKFARFNYIHAHFAAYHAEWAMAIARLLDLPFGITGHATGIWKDRNILPLKVRSARIFLTCTCHNAEHLRGLAPDVAGRVTMLYHGIELDRLPTPSPLPSTTTWQWLAVGRLIEKKGFGVLIDACAMLRDRGATFVLRIVGDGPDRDALQARVREAQLENHVLFAGAQPNARVWQLLADSHALVAPSMRAASGDIDGIPNVILEAFAAGRPVVGSRLSGIPEVVVPDQTGEICEPGDVLSLADAMQRLSADHQRAQRLATAARAWIERDFDVRVNVARQVELLAAARDSGDHHHGH